MAKGGILMQFISNNIHWIVFVIGLIASIAIGFMFSRHLSEKDEPYTQEELDKIMEYMKRSKKDL